MMLNGQSGRIATGFGRVPGTASHSSSDGHVHARGQRDARPIAPSMKQYSVANEKRWRPMSTIEVHEAAAVVRLERDRDAGTAPKTRSPSIELAAQIAMASRVDAVAQARRRDCRGDRCAVQLSINQAAPTPAPMCGRGTDQPERRRVEVPAWWPIAGARSTIRRGPAPTIAVGLVRPVHQSQRARGA